MRSGDVPEWMVFAAQAIMQTVKAKDVETYWHCLRVGKNSRLLAHAAGLSDYEQKVVEYSGIFHDIGKVGVPDQILLKPGKLTDEEYAVMKDHPEKSAEILQPLMMNQFVLDVIPGVRHHHERIDGRGYGHGLSGDQIPLSARIILIADTFDAMTADRAYRKGLPEEVAHQELLDFSGRQFDAQLVKIFLQAKATWQKQEERVSRDLHREIVQLHPNVTPLEPAHPHVREAVALAKKAHEEVRDFSHERSASLDKSTNKSAA